MSIPSSQDLELEWLKTQKDIKDQYSVESSKEKFFRKFMENPLIPIGAFATTIALSVGLWSVKSGQRKLSQQMMRARVLAQGLTIAALVGGITLGVSKVSQAEKSDK